MERKAVGRSAKPAGAGFNKNVVGEVRVNKGRNENTSFVIVDAQSVKNRDTARNKGDDAGKKVSGIKRRIAVDTQGLPHAIAVTTADVTDRKGAVEALSHHNKSLSKVVHVMGDSGYTVNPRPDYLSARRLADAPSKYRCPR